MTSYTVTALASRAGTTKYSFILQLEAGFQVEGELHVDIATGCCLARGLQGSVRDNSGAPLGSLYCSRVRGNGLQETLDRQMAAAAEKAATRPWEEYLAQAKALKEAQTRVDKAPLPPAAVATAAAAAGYMPMTFRSHEREWYGWTRSSGTAAFSWRDCSWPGEPFCPGFDAAFTIEDGMDPGKGAVRFFTNHGRYAARIGDTRVEILPGWPA